MIRKTITNVYDFFQKMEPKSNSAALDEEVTARIKRHMANLLYPVDMASFVRPEMRPPNKVRSQRRSPPPWTVEEQAACFVVRDHNGQQLAYVVSKTSRGAISGHAADA
jgi:hypothetical protein